jgi:transketolase
VGVAESNMIGVAAGLALGGYRPFVYSIVPFATLRCLEQIRNDVCYNNVPVTIVGVGGGYSYGPNGPTHHALEDIAAMRSLPNMTVVCPADPVEAELAVPAIGSHDGPAYLRLGRAGDPVVHQKPPVFRIGEAITVRRGSDCTLISTGGMLPVALEAAALLDGEVSCRVVSMHTVKPLDSRTLRECSRETEAFFTVEEHSRIGGLGSAVGEWLAESDLQFPLHSLGTPDSFAHFSGSQEFLRNAQGLSAHDIAGGIRTRLRSGARLLKIC